MKNNKINKNKEIKARFCPNCKSLNVVAEAVGAQGVRTKWICKDCGYENAEFPIITK